MNLSSINAHTHASSRKSQSDWRKYHLSLHAWPESYMPDAALQKIVELF